MNRKDIDEIICATDADREGECIFRYVYKLIGCKKPVKRLWVSSLEESAIKSALSSMKSSSEYDSLYSAGFCRLKADWIVGMNGTRLFSVRYNSKITVGRVQTPTLAMIVQRDNEVRNFVKQRFFTVDLNCGSFVASSKRIDDELEAEKLLALVNGKDADVSELKKEVKTVNPPKLYDLTTLQCDANQYFGYTAQQTLDSMQKLYEAQLVTYPRTDSQYISDDMEETAMQRVSDVAEVFHMFGKPDSVNVKRCINNAKVSGHHAILPTGGIKSKDLNSLSEEENNILKLVSARLIMVVAEPQKYEAVKVTVTCENTHFTAIGKTVIKAGWKALETKINAALKNKDSDENEKKEASLPEMQQGVIFKNVSACKSEHWTSLPKSYTEKRTHRPFNGNVEPYEDNLLKITGEARYFSLGNQALQAIYTRKDEEPPFEIQQNKDGKVDKCIENVVRIYNENNETKGVQLVFSDIAVNSDNGNFSVYDYIKNELVAQGIPENEIIFAPKSDSKNREEIFKDINAGKYRVVIASTNTLETGANIQEKLCALHHLDIPWKPSDFEQREGRILRQGNSFSEVEIFNYVTEGTMDSYLYQTVANKARFIAQFLNNENVGRSMEDCDGKVLTYGEFQAQAEGNPDFRRFVELGNEISELNMLRSEYAHETVLTQKTLEELPIKIEVAEHFLAGLEADKKIAEQNKDVVLTKENGERIYDKKSINVYLISMLEAKAKSPELHIPSVKICGFDINVERKMLSTNMKFTIAGSREYVCEAGITDKQDNVQRIVNLLEKTIPKRIEDTKKEIVFFESNIQQVEERIAAPFPKEQELFDKKIEYAELEMKLVEIDAHEDIYDPDDTPLVETAVEKSERSSVQE